MNGNGQPIPTIDDLIEDPARVAVVPPQMAQSFLIGLASIQPLLIQRALMGTVDGQKEHLLLTIKEVAQRIKVSEYRAYELARHGILKCLRIGKSVRVKPEDLTEYLARQEC